MHKSGFTLIELIIVIAILAILAGMAVIPFTYYIRKAKAKELVNFARACVQEAITECMTDNSTDTSTLDACQNPDDTRYITNIQFTTLPTCNNFSATIQGDVGEETYQVTCTYDTTTDDVICSAPQRIST